MLDYLIAFFTLVLCGLSVLLIVVLFVPCVSAEISLRGIFEKLPALKEGVMYSVPDCEIYYISTAQIFEYKGISIEGGYSPKDMAIGTISYSILKVKDLGINVPIIDLIELNVGITAGIKRIGTGDSNNEFDWGPSLTLINIKY